MVFTNEVGARTDMAALYDTSVKDSDPDTTMVIYQRMKKYLKESTTSPKGKSETLSGRRAM